MESFNCLPLKEKEALLLQHGKYVLSTDFYGAQVKLFALDNFYIEVYYHPVLEKVMRISVASDEELLKHLVKISFSF
jgi:hypothetical protein